MTMASIRLIRGNILDDPSDILVCPVNCIPGVMGKGLALAFAERWPELKEEHRRACQERGMEPGQGRGVDVADGRRVFLFPTKEHWKDTSQYLWIWDGLTSLRA